MTRRSLLAAAGWVAAAVLAVLVGLAAISVIGSGLMSSSGSTPRTQADVARELAAQPPPSDTAGPSESPPTSTPPAPNARSFPTRGGTVVARCAANGAEIVSMSPNQGFTVHDQDQGVQVEAEGEFRGAIDNHDRVKVRVTCSAGRPDLSTRNEG